jgi:hypothetical protein
MMSRTFFIRPDALSQAFPNSEQERAIREAISQLIQRYDLRGKKVLSLGAALLARNAGSRSLAAMS